MRGRGGGSIVAQPCYLLAMAHKGEGERALWLTVCQSISPVVLRERVCQLCLLCSRCNGGYVQHHSACVGAADPSVAVPGLQEQCHQECALLRLVPSDMCHVHQQVSPHTALFVLRFRPPSPIIELWTCILCRHWSNYTHH